MKLKGVLMRYVRPKEHLCRASKVWLKLREEAAEEAVDLSKADGPFLTRVEKEGFLAGIVPQIIEEHEPMGKCSCEKAAKMKEIKKLLKSLLELEEKLQREEKEIQQEEIDRRYTDLERLLGLSKPSLS